MTLVEFEAWLAAYARPLQVRPPIGRQANFREWMDPSLGPWPANVVAKVTRHRKSVLYEVLA